MNTWILIFIIVVLPVLLLAKRKTRESIVDICGVAFRQGAQKSERKEEILTSLGDGKELSNADIRAAFGISERSVVRYMNELEKEGKIEQVGKTGRSVTYRLKY